MTTTNELSSGQPPTNDDTRIIWVGEADIPRIMEIIKAAGDVHEGSYSREAIGRCLHDHSRIPLLAEDRTTKQALGFMIYEIMPDTDGGILRLNQLIVAPQARRRGVGRQLLSEMKRELIALWPMAQYIVNEWNLVGQLFLRSMGFLAKQTLSEGHDDYYLMVLDPRAQPIGEQHVQPSVRPSCQGSDH